MKLLKLSAKHYRSLRDVSLEFSDLNLFIGANASGKSTLLDTLRFLQEAVQTRDFRAPVFSRGGIIHLAWKGKEAERIDVSVKLADADKTWEWSVRLIRAGYEFQVEEQLDELPPGSPPVPILHANRGDGWWWSGTEKRKITLKQAPTACALTAAAADASFPAREVAEFVSRWGFFDPNPFLLRHDWTGLDSGGFDPYGRNLAETLHALQNSSPEVVKRICSATQSIVGLPSAIEARESEGRFYFVQFEPGLQFSVHQMGVSSGTLRMLALMTALLGQPETTLIGIEEPENYVHPTALSSFVEHLLNARGRVQFLVTTHSPLLLDFLNDPAAVRVVQHNEHEGTMVVQEKDPEGVRSALDASGFGLGQFYETKGFGAG
jgi:predicted ATPase